MSTTHSHRRHHHGNAAGTLSRRLLLGLAGAGAIGVGGTLPSAVAKEPGTRTESMPRTLVEMVSGTGTATVAFPVGYVGVRWTGPHQGVGIRFRSADGTFEQ